MVQRRRLLGEDDDSTAIAEIREVSDVLAGLSGQQLEKPRGGGLAQWRKLPNDHYGDCVKIGQVSWWVRRGDFYAEEMNAIEERKQNEGVPEE